MKFTGLSALACVGFLATAALAEERVAIIVPPNLGVDWQAQMGETLGKMVVDLGAEAIIQPLNRPFLQDYAEALQSAVAAGAARAIVPEFSVEALSSLAESMQITQEYDTGTRYLTMDLGYGWKGSSKDGGRVFFVPQGRDITLDPARLTFWDFGQDTEAAKNAVDTYKSWLDETDMGQSLIDHSALLPTDWQDSLTVIPTPITNDDDDDGCGCDDENGALLTCNPDGYSMNIGDFGFTPSGGLRLGPSQDDGGCGTGCEMRSLTLDSFMNSETFRKAALAGGISLNGFTNKLSDLDQSSQIITVMICNPD